MVDLQVLEKRGITSDSLKKLLSNSPDDMKGVPADKQNKLTKLRNRIKSRIEEGRSRNFAEYKTHYALDLAWDVPFRQITPTLVNQFIDKDPNNEDVRKQINAWGMTGLLTEARDAKTGAVLPGKKVMNLPVFFNVLVPLVKTYVTRVQAELMNARNQDPFLKFEPAKQTASNKFKCEVITDRINLMSAQMGYFTVQEQAVLKMLHYAICLQFIAEEWYPEEQWLPADKSDVEQKKETFSDGKEKKPAKEGDPVKVIVKEGLRYHLPHPSRTYRDLAHPPSTFNSDTGCQFAGYWRLKRYSEIHGGGMWNTDKIPISSVDLIGTNRLFFDSVYAGCLMNYPTTTASATGSTLMAGAGSTDRETQLQNQFYGASENDKAVLVTEHFERCIPSQDGLGDYDCPVWFRFVLGGDQATFLYAAPLPDFPVIYYGYQADESRSQNASLSMTILPFQDQFGMVLSQIVLTAKQNLANLTLIDEDQITEETKEWVTNIGGKMFAGINVQGFSGRKAYRGQNKVVDALQSFSLPKGNVAELINVMRTILDVMERVLMISSQAVSQAASHEQTREEVRTISAAVSTGMQFTGTAVDRATDAWKRQLYSYLMAYGDDDFYAHIPVGAQAVDKKLLDELGFTYVDSDSTVRDTDRFRKIKIKKNKVAVDLYSFASTRHDIDRGDDHQAAIAMAQVMQMVMNNPIMAQAIGPDQAIDLATQLSHLAGLPRDFKLRNVGLNPEKQKEEAQAQLKGVVDQVMQATQANLEKSLTPIIDAIKTNTENDAGVAQKVGQTDQALTQIIDTLKTLMSNLPQNQPPSNDFSNANPDFAGPS